MSDTIIPLRTIPPGAEITLTVNTDLYIRLQQCLLEALPYKDEEEFKKILEEVTKGSPKEGLSYHFHSLVHLLYLIEAAAEKQGIIKMEKFDLETKRIVK